MTAADNSARSLLERAYQDLDLVKGALVEARDTPGLGDEDDSRWRELGDWLLLASRVGAEKVFFVNDDPVLVFASLPSGSDERDALRMYRRAWSLARPRCLFLALGHELRVYSLGQPPSGPSSAAPPVTPLEIVYRAGDVQDRLGRFHRDRLESGATFEDPELLLQRGRADQQLLRDVRVATSALIDSGLTPHVAHALIERAILVRYLEDRGVLTPDYFHDVAAKHDRSIESLRSDMAVPTLGASSQFLLMLPDKLLTYALFESLSSDFNGDLFILEPEERNAVTKRHLLLLRELFEGSSSATQDPLFFWAYDFSVIPTSLVSTMYETFYRQESDGTPTSTYYTPPELVESVLSNALDTTLLERAPRILDPACGSGIFLVEAFRRIVRYEAARSGESLGTSRLRDILLGQIAGCDIDAAAIRLAAFSLYVAFLNYQDPRDIRSAGPLPPLVQRSESDASAPLAVADAFAVDEDDRGMLPGQHAEHFPWADHSFDLVVGNPPWTEPRTASASIAELWAIRRKLPVGDRSPSQLFLWRALDLLSDNGIAALLVSAKAMLNERSTARAFRAKWLVAARVEHVINFAEVRHDFFVQGVAPFMFLRFRRSFAGGGDAVVYETARRVPQGRRGSSALARLDRRVVPQSSLHARDYLWKTYSAGGHRDAALLARLELEARLRDLARDDQRPQYGFQRASPHHAEARPAPKELRQLKTLTKFNSWGPLRDEWFEPTPKYVKRAPDERLYHGRRLLIRRGVSPRFGPHARLETKPFAFRHTVYAIPLEHVPAWQAKIALATLLSELGRYWLFMTSGSWGTWKDEVRADDILDLPLRIPSTTNSLTRRISSTVDALAGAADPVADLWQAGRSLAVEPILAAIDDSVAQLFELSESERDLVHDFWIARTSESNEPIPDELSTNRGYAEDLDATKPGIERYLKVFLGAWGLQLGGRGELAWRIWREPGARLLAVVFESRPLGERDRRDDSPMNGSWSQALQRLGAVYRPHHRGTLLTNGVVRAVTDEAILIIKRDEKRMWTATAAREDADATVAQVLALEHA